MGSRSLTAIFAGLRCNCTAPLGCALNRVELRGFHTDLPRCGGAQLLNPLRDNNGDMRLQPPVVRYGNEVCLY